MGLVCVYFFFTLSCVRPHYALLLLIGYNLALTIGAGIFFHRNVIAPYFNPRIRWWDQATRYKINIFLTIDAAEKIIKAEIKDISASGVFIACAERLTKGSTYAITLHMIKHLVGLNAVVMRESKQAELSGYGLMFVGVTDTQKEGLNRLIRHLKKIGLINKIREKRENKSLRPEVAPRYTVDTGAVVQAGAANIPALIFDVSRGGCLIQPISGQELAQKDNLRLSLKCLNQELTVNGSVKWNTMRDGEPVYGISFIFENRAQRAQIKKILAECKKARAPNRLVDSKPLPDSVILTYALNSPYKIVYEIKKKLVKP
jgi:hypothetical protein